MPAWTYGMFVWRELSTNDVDGSLRFYGELAGWKPKKVEMPNGAYYLLHKGDKQVGGLMALEQGVDMPPYWMSYVSVPASTRPSSRPSASGARSSGVLSTSRPSAAWRRWSTHAAARSRS